MSKRRQKPWSEKEHKLLRKLYANTPYEKLAVIFRRSAVAIKSRAMVLGLRRSNRKYWTAKENAELRRLYPHSRDSKALAVRFSCTLTQLYAQAKRHGIGKTPKTHLAINRLSGDNLRVGGFAHRYPKGHVPANKGTRRPGYAPGRMRETQFKKGQLPHTWMPIGATRLVGGYVYRKVSDIRNVVWTRNWVAEHIRLWEEVHGPLNRRTHVLRFRDGDRYNISLDNLELITRRENRIRNSIHNLPKPLKEVIMMKAAIRAQITRKNKRMEASA